MGSRRARSPGCFNWSKISRGPRQVLQEAGRTELWEIRADFGGNAFRLIGFLDGEQLVILTSGFAKKTQKTPKQEIDTALARRNDYYNLKKG